MNLDQLKESIVKEQQYDAEIAERCKAPLRGKGIKKGTYAVRRQLLEKDEAKYKRVIEHVVPWADTHLKNLPNLYKSFIEAEKEIGRDVPMTKDQLWRQMLKFTQVAVGLKSITGFLYLYGAYERELDTLAQVRYGTEGLSQSISWCMDQAVEYEARSLQPQGATVSKVSNISDLVKALESIRDTGELPSGILGRSDDDDNGEQMHQGAQMLFAEAIAEMLLIKAGVYAEIYGVDIDL